MIVFLLLALLGFVASVIVHVSTFAANQPIGMQNVWPLHIGIFIVFLPMLLSQKSARRKSKTLTDQFPTVPRWMRVVIVICFVYAIVNFILAASSGAFNQRRGKITTVNGQHVLRSHGQTIRTVSDEEFRRHGARVARAFSGHWMIFYWVSFVGLYDGLRRRQATRAAMPVPPALPQILRQTNSYERAPTPHISPWFHATLGAVLSMVGFFVLPFALMALVFHIPHGPGHGGGGAWFCLVAPLFLGGAIAGFTFPGRWIARYIPAACPSCHGRAYANGPALSNRNEPLTYTCRECGAVCGTDGSLITRDDPSDQGAHGENIVV